MICRKRSRQAAGLPVPQREIRQHRAPQHLVARQAGVAAGRLLRLLSLVRGPVARLARLLRGVVLGLRGLLDGRVRRHAGLCGREQIGQKPERRQTHKPSVTRDEHWSGSRWEWQHRTVHHSAHAAGGKCERLRCPRSRAQGSQPAGETHLLPCAARNVARRLLRLLSLLRRPVARLARLLGRVVLRVNSLLRRDVLRVARLRNRRKETA